MQIEGKLLGTEAQWVETCGGIAAGKTTLSAALNITALTPIHENFQSNPFWKAFYADPAETAFETEISFLLQHYHEIKSASKQGKFFACDFSLLLDLAYAEVTLNEEKRAAFMAVYQIIRRELPPPALVIHLVCDPEIELERIRKRGRDVEQSISLDYLSAINTALTEVIEKEATDWNVLTIDSVKFDFANSERDKEHVLELVNTRLASCRPD